MNTIILKIPQLFSQFTAGKSIIELKAQSTNDALFQLVENYPKLKSHIFTDTQQLQSYICLFLNDKQIMHDTPIGEKDVLKIITAMIGG